MVIMKKLDYTPKILNLLSDTNSYKVVPHNPCKKIIKKFKAMIKNSSFDDDGTKNYLFPYMELTH